MANPHPTGRRKAGVPNKFSAERALAVEREGKRLDDNAVHTWHVKDGKATEFWGVSLDPYADDEFWS